MADKDNEREFIVGVSQGEEIGKLSVDSFKENYIFQLFEDARNSYEAYNRLEFEQTFDELIRNSEYRHLYESLDNISAEDGVYIYLKFKDVLKHKFLMDSNVIVFIRILEILNVNINRALLFMPLDEKIMFDEELKKGNLYNEIEKHIKLF